MHLFPSMLVISRRRRAAWEPREKRLPCRVRPSYPPPRKPEVSVIGPTLHWRAIEAVSRHAALLTIASALATSQTVTVTAPVSNQTISVVGYTQLCATVASSPSVAQVEFFVDTESQGVAKISPYCIQWSPYQTWNGAHTVYAISSDTLQNILATSATVAFNTAVLFAGVSYSIAPSISVSSMPADGATWSGTVATTITIANRPSDAASTLQFYVKVDGVQVGGGSTGIVSSANFNIDTTKFPNGIHKVAMSAGPFDFNPYPYGYWERAEDFENGKTAMELRLNAREVYLASGGGTFQITPAIYNTDGTTSSGAGTTYASSNTSACTVTSPGGLVTAGTWTAQTSNSAKITATNGLLTRVLWCFPTTSNVVAHFGNDGQIYQNWTAGKSLLLHSSFFSDIGVMSQPTGFGTAAAQAATDYVAAGFNAVESSCISPIGTNQASYQTAQTALAAKFAGWAAAYPGLHTHCILDAQLKVGSDLYNTTRGVGTTWTPDNAITFAFKSLLTASVIGSSNTDEAGKCCSWGNNLQYKPQIGTSAGLTAFNSITAASGVCTVAWDQWSIQAGGTFIIHGATTNTALNSAAGTSFAFHSTGTSSFTFSCPGVADGVIKSATDPGLIIEPFDGVYAGNDYTHWDAFINFTTWANLAGSSRMKMTYPVIGIGLGPYQNYNLMGPGTGATPIADYAEVYPPILAFYNATRFGLNSAVTNYGDVFRSVYASVPNTEPIIALSHGIIVNFGYGYSTPVTNVSASNDIFTFPAGHGITTLAPGFSRATLSAGMSGPYNAQYYIYKVLNATQLGMALRYPTFSSSATGVTVTFDSNGDTIYGASFSLDPGSTGTMTPPAGAGCTIANNHRGDTFGWSLDGTKFWLSSTASACPGVPSLVIRQLPSGSTSGAAANIIQDDYFHPGQSIVQFGQGPQDPDQSFFERPYVAILGGAGERTYTIPFLDMDAFSSPLGLSSTSLYYSQLFQSSPAFSGNWVQAGPNPEFDNGYHATANFAAMGMGNLFVNRLTKFLYQPRLNSPDYGRLFEATARSGSNGNLLMIQSVNDGTYTITANLAPYLIDGQNILRLVGNYQHISVSTIAAGTSIDTVSLGPGWVVAYIFSNSYATDAPMQPTVTALLSDVPNATRLVIQYAYLPYWLTNGKAAGMDCGTGTCTLPLDRNIGPIYYRLIYLNSSGAMLAPSDIQEF